MKSVRKALFILMGCLLFNAGFSQNHLRIGLDSTFSLPPANIVLGDTFDFHVRVYNDSNSAYTGIIAYNWQILPDTAVFNGPSNTSGIYYPFSGADSIPAHGFISRMFTAHVTNPAFKQGPSVVVIWPRSFFDASIVAADSLKFGLTVDSLVAGISENQGQTLNLHKQGNLLFIEKDTEIRLMRVRIFDVLGQQILDKQDPSNTVPLPYMNNGIYLVEILSGSDNVTWQKLVLQK